MNTKTTLILIGALFVIGIIAGIFIGKAMFAPVVKTVTGEIKSDTAKVDTIEGKRKFVDGKFAGYYLPDNWKDYPEIKRILDSLCMSRLFDSLSFDSSPSTHEPYFRSMQEVGEEVKGKKPPLSLQTQGYEVPKFYLDDSTFFESPFSLNLSIRPDTNAKGFVSVPVTAHWQAWYYRGKMLGSKLWLDPVVFDYQDDKKVVNEWTGYPLVSFMSSIRVKSNWAIGIGVNVKSWGVMVHAPVEKDGKFDLELIKQF